MQLKTHLAITVFAIILFFPIVNNPVLFAIVALFATFIPDMDTPFTKIGNKKISKVAQVFTSHRGFIHSLTFCLLISILLAVFIPILAFSFFLGFSLHLLADSFTKMGITPFWPYSRKAQGVLNTGGVVEKGIFFIFIFLDLLFVMAYLF